MRGLSCFGLFAFAIASSSLSAHEAASGWDYPFECCYSADCAQIDPDAVREHGAGFTVTIAPGRHPMWPVERRAPLILDVPHRKARLSPDGLWHLCIDDSGELLCFFSPGGDS